MGAAAHTRACAGRGAVVWAASKKARRAALAAHPNRMGLRARKDPRRRARSTPPTPRASTPASATSMIAHHGSPAFPDGGGGDAAPPLPPVAAVGTVDWQSPLAPIGGEARVGWEPGANHGQEEPLPVRYPLVQPFPAADVRMQRSYLFRIVYPRAIIQERINPFLLGQHALQTGTDGIPRDVLPLRFVRRRAGPVRGTGPSIEAAPVRSRRT